MDENLKAALGRVRCVLCGSPADRRRYDGGGWEYHCSGPCHHFAVPGNLHYLLELENVFPPQLKKRISFYLMSLAAQRVGNCHELTKDVINAATGETIL